MKVLPFSEALEVGDCGEIIRFTFGICSRLRI